MVILLKVVLYLFLIIGIVCEIDMFKNEDEFIDKFLHAIVIIIVCLLGFCVYHF